MARSKEQARKRKAPESQSTKNLKKNKKDVAEEETEEQNENTEEQNENTEEVDEVTEKKEEIVYAKVEENSDSGEIRYKTNEWNLKIMSWNVNGIRSWFDQKGLEFVKSEAPDVFCCQETKCDKSKIPPATELKGYHSYWLSGDKQGYSGVGVMSKVKPISVKYGIDDKKFDSEGRVITAEFENYYLINSYIPNSSRGLTRLPFRLEWETAFLKYIKELDKKKPVIWCGDLNVAHQRIDIKNPDSNKKSAGFTVEERDCFTKLLGEGFIDSFRHLYPTKEGAYTYWSNFNNARQKNVGWRLDYFVLSERMKEQLVDSSMYPAEKGSDHCPVILHMKL